MDKVNSVYLRENDSNFTWDKIKDLSESDIQKQDKLNFYSQAETELDIITNNKFNNGKSLFIEGPWGSGKSTFINILLWHFQKKFRKDKFIPIFFDPWYVIDAKTFFESYFETIKNVLSSYKYSEKLSNSIDGFLSLLEGIENPILKNIKKIFLNKGVKSSIREQINKIIQVINEDYKEYTICIVIDEIDRLSRDNLHELSKILDISKQLSDYCKNIYLIMGWDSIYLNKILIDGQDTLSISKDISQTKPISMSKYLEKFQNRRISIYRTDIIVGIIKEIIKSFSPGNQYQRFNSSESSDIIEKVLKDLRDKGIIVNIRKLYQIDIVLHHIKSDFAKENDKISEISINNILNPSDIAFTIYLYLLIIDNPNILYDLNSHFKLNNWYEDSKAKSKLEELITKLGINNEILMDCQKKGISTREYLIRIVSIIGNDISNMSDMKLEALYSLISYYIKENKIKESTQLTIKYKDYLFEGKDDWSQGPNGLSLVWRNLNQVINDETYKNTFEYLKSVISETEIMNYIFSNYSILSETIDDITHTIAHYYHYYQGTDSHREEKEIERELIANDKKTLFRLIFYYWLYLLSIAKNNSGYEYFESYFRDIKDDRYKQTNIDIAGLQIDFSSEYQGSKYLGIKRIETINKIIDEDISNQNTGHIDSRLHSIEPKIDEIEIIYICRRIISLFQNDRLLDGSKMQEFIEKTMSKKTQLQLLFGIVEKDEIRTAQIQYIISSDLYSKEIIEDRLKLTDDECLLAATPLYIFQNINSTVKLQPIDKNKEEIKKIKESIKKKYGIE